MNSTRRNVSTAPDSHESAESKYVPPSVVWVGNLSEQTLGGSRHGVDFIGGSGPAGPCKKCPPKCPPPCQRRRR